MDDDTSVAWSDDDPVPKPGHEAPLDGKEPLAQPAEVTRIQGEGPGKEEEGLSVAWSDGASIAESERSVPSPWETTGPRTREPTEKASTHDQGAAKEDESILTDESWRTEQPPPPPPPALHPVASAATLPPQTVPVPMDETAPLSENEPPVLRAHVATDEEPADRDEESVSWSDDSGRSASPPPPPILPATIPATRPEESANIYGTAPVQRASHSQPSDQEEVLSTPASEPELSGPRALLTEENPIPPRTTFSTATLKQEQQAPLPESETSIQRETIKPSEPALIPDSEPLVRVLSPAPTAKKTDYSNVFCGPVEGRLEVTDRRIHFIPNAPDKIPPYNPIPYIIAWKDTTYHEFYTENVKAGYQSYQTVMTSYNLKIGVIPSKEATFSVRSAEVWDCMKIDWDARGYGVPPLPQYEKEAPDAGASPQTASCLSANEYDHSEAVYDDLEEQVHWNDEEERVEEASKQQDRNAAEEEGIRWSDEEDDGADAEEVLRASSTIGQTPKERTEEFGNVNDAWPARDGASNPPSSYYPVTCKREVGNLVLTGSELQFIPDKHSAVVKSIPFAAFAGRPFFSPPSHPIAQVAVHYHTTQGPNKKVGFELDNHDELLRLEGDIKDRMEPFKRAPKEKVYVLPKSMDIPRYSESSFSYRGGDGGLISKPHVVHKNSDASVTEETMSFGGEGLITAASRPLVANTARRVPYHKAEPKRRLILLFMSYCCIATLAGLTFSVLFGYFFGPRRPKEQYIRTQSPYQIGEDYIRTRPPASRPPSVAPTLKIFDEWNSDGVTMSRTMTEPPAGASENPNENKISAGTKTPQDGPFGDGTMGSGIGRPAPGSDINRPGSGMGSGESFRGADFELLTGVPIEMSAPTWAPTGMIVPRTMSGPSTTAPTSGEPTIVPTGEPTTAPTSRESTKAPTTPVPTVLVTRSNKSIVALLMEKSPDKGANLRTPGTPQQAAYLLMKVSGLLEDAPSDDMILQKYAMSTLYYASGGNDWTEGSNSWKELAGTDCNKPHIICDGATGETLGIEMKHNNMVGSLPPEIGLLGKLTYLSFEDNSLEGGIPTEIGLLKNLQTLDLAGNSKLEPLPDQVRSLPRLATVKVDTP